MKHLVIGLGEVGNAIQSILECEGHDLAKQIVAQGEFEILHICIPYSRRFKDIVLAYKATFKADLIVVHSSVPLGTCDPHGWVHSPVRGVHPNLEEGIRTFIKFFGGERAGDAAQFFVERGILVRSTAKAATTEALKLWDTTQYGVMIALQKEIYAYCKRHELDFDVVYKEANESYNNGYRALGRREVVRPYLNQKDGPIGGHCVIPNARIMREQEAGHYMVMLEGLLGVNALLEDSQDTAQGE